jgi:inner membrane protein
MLQSVNLSLKMIAVGALVLVCLFPSMLIYGLVEERSSRRWEAVSDISAKWAQEQQLDLPMLSIDSLTDPKGVWQTETLSPQVLHVFADVQPELRSRGIFSVPVYTAQVIVEGTFQVPQTIAGVSPQWSAARLSFGTSDLGGLTEPPELRVGDRVKPLANDVPIATSLDTGAPLKYSNERVYPFVASEDVSGLVQATVPVEPGQELSFRYSFALRGTEALMFERGARTMVVNVTSPWTSPSFIGSLLPSQRSLTEAGFTANWQTSSWLSPQLESGNFGVRLVEEVDTYDLVSRSMKYAILFIGLTFLVFFLVEVLTKQHVHPFQYLLVGAALCLFYLLLLSLAEHVGFTSAFVTSAVATIGVIGWYSASVLRRASFAASVTLLLTVLYSYLYTLLQMEDYALLMGSAILFIILVSVMAVTRRVNWYA